MKILKRLFEKTETYFEKDGKLEKLFPIFEATKTLFFLPAGRTTSAPLIRDNLDLKRFMSFVILALLPALFFGIYNTGLQSCIQSGLKPGFIEAFITGAGYVVPLIIVSYGVGFFWEFLFSIIRKHSISEGFLVTGLLFPLVLPPDTPLWQVAIGISFGVVIGKEVFGGTGRNILNPALTARAFLFFSYPASMSGDSVWVASKSGVDAVSGATPLSIIAPGSENITEALNQAGYTLKSLFFGFYPGSVGETSSLLILIGALFLIITGIASYRIILGGIAGLLITALLFMLLPGDPASWFSAGPLYHMLSGGFLFGITFMATDPVSAAGTNTGRWVYGFLIGFLTVLIRAVNPAFVEGTMLAILFMNIFAPVIDHVIIKLKSGKRIPNV